MRVHLAVLLLVVTGLSGQSSADELRVAVQHGDVKLVKSLLQSGSNVNKSYENGRTPIYFADEAEVVELLLDHGANIESRDLVWNQSPLEHAAEQFSWDQERRGEWKAIVERLRKAGAIYTIDAAICLNDIEFIRAALEKNASWLNRQDGYRHVPLGRAARLGHVEICKLLLDHKADPNAFEQGCGFPIMVSAAEHPAIVKLLIEHGANLRRRITFNGDRSGSWTVGDEASILHHVVCRGNFESVKLLVEAGVDPNATDVCGQTPLHLAIRFDKLRRDEDEARREVDEAFHPSEQIESPNESIIKYLLDNDASLRFMNMDRNTPLDLAKKLRSPDSIIQLLEEHAEKQASRRCR